MGVRLGKTCKAHKIVWLVFTGIPVIRIPASAKSNFQQRLCQKITRVARFTRDYVLLERNVRVILKSRSVIVNSRIT